MARDGAGRRPSNTKCKKNLSSLPQPSSIVRKRSHDSGKETELRCLRYTKMGLGCPKSCITFVQLQMIVEGYLNFSLGIFWTYLPAPSLAIYHFLVLVSSEMISI